jgi:hypothetical protein
MQIRPSPLPTSLPNQEEARTCTRQPSSWEVSAQKKAHGHEPFSTNRKYSDMVRADSTLNRRDKSGEGEDSHQVDVTLGDLEQHELQQLGVRRGLVAAAGHGGAGHGGAGLRTGGRGEGRGSIERGAGGESGSG